MLDSPELGVHEKAIMSAMPNTESSKEFLIRKSAKALMARWARMAIRKCEPY